MNDETTAPARPAYDTQEGIAAALADYPSFYALTRARATSPEAASGTLTEYFVRSGTLLLTHDGGVACVHDNASPPVIADVVLTRAEYDDARVAQGGDRRYGWGGLHMVPPHVGCAMCGQHWTLDGLPTMRTNAEFQYVGAPQYLGLTLLELQAAFDIRTNAAYQVRTTVMNDRWQGTGSSRGEREDAYRDERSADPKITLDYVLQSGDQVLLQVTTFYHEGCYAQKEHQDQANERDEQAESFRQIVLTAGFDDATFERVPMPDHLLDSLGEEEMSDAERAAAADEFVYLRVKTSLGDFAMVMFAYPGMDINDSGVTYAELVTALGGDPAEMTPIPGMESVIMFADPQPLIILHQLMSKKKIAALTAAAAKPGDKEG